MSNNVPHLTVIVPTHNNSQTIRECLDSILMQDYPNFDILVVDSESHDGTVNIVLRIMKYEKRVGITRSVIVNTEPGGRVLVVSPTFTYSKTDELSWLFNFSTTMKELVPRSC